MTLQEFKAWFEGFTEAMDDRPSLAQWKRIQERVGEIDGVALTQHVYYPAPYYPAPPTYRWYWNGLGTTAAIPLANSNPNPFSTMTALGRSDAEAAT